MGTSPRTSPSLAGREVLNFCANNYLGLADHPALVAAAKEALDSHGLGMASVRFICGTSDLHLALERRIAGYLGDGRRHPLRRLLRCQWRGLRAALRRAGRDRLRCAEPCLDHRRHPPVEGRRFRFANGDMNDLEVQLRAARQAGARRVIIVTDGVFSMDGYFAKLPEIRKLADAHDALIMVDDCHATGFIGPQGRGTPARAGVKVDILTGTFGKAPERLGRRLYRGVASHRGPDAAAGGPYLFSNALPPPIVAASLKAIDLAEAGDDLRAHLFDNASASGRAWRRRASNLLPGEHPIIPVMLGEAKLAQDMAAKLYGLGVYVTVFSFPSCRKGRLAFGPRCRRRIRPPTSTRPSMPSNRRARVSE